MPEPVPHAEHRRPASTGEGREPGEHAEEAAADERDEGRAAAAGHLDVPPYYAVALYADGRWHLTVDSLNDHPDRGEVDSVVVTVTPKDPGGDLPEAELDSELRQCGFDRRGEWTREGDGWSTPCAQSDPGAAPAPGPPPPQDTSEEQPPPGAGRGA